MKDYLQEMILNDNLKDYQIRHSLTHQDIKSDHSLIPRPLLSSIIFCSFLLGIFVFFSTIYIRGQIVIKIWTG